MKEGEGWVLMCCNCRMHRTSTTQTTSRMRFASISMDGGMRLQLIASLNRKLPHRRPASLSRVSGFPNSMNENENNAPRNCDYERDSSLFSSQHESINRSMNQSS